MFFVILQSFLACGPDVYCYPEGEENSSSIPTPSDDREESTTEPTSEPTGEPTTEEETFKFNNLFFQTFPKLLLNYFLHLPNSYNFIRSKSIRTSTSTDLNSVGVAQS